MKTILIATAFFLFFSCSNNEDDGNGLLKEDQISTLTETQVSNFVTVLPLIHEFSKKYREGLPETELNSPDFNKGFFKTLRESERVKSASQTAGFKDMDELLTVYKNIIFAYINLKTEFTNFNVQIVQITARMEQFQQQKQEELKSPSLSQAEKDLINKQLDGLKNDKALLSNIVIIQKYETNIDAYGGE